MVAGLTMRVAVISDVHANYHALTAVLEEIDDARVDAIWCLGDTVGYGPLPNECCETVSARADVCLVGNHDLVVLGELAVSDFNDEAARTTFELSQAPLVLVGHSHVALALTFDGADAEGGLAPAGTELELGGRRLLNPGSVGQPRDGDPRAAWLLLDLERRFAAFHRVAYSIDRTQAEMRERGLPRALAARLERGE